MRPNFLQRSLQQADKQLQKEALAVLYGSKQKKRSLQQQKLLKLAKQQSKK